MLTGKPVLLRLIPSKPDVSQLVKGESGRSRAAQEYGGRAMPDQFQLSLRLKAARWLNGYIDEKGTPKAMHLDVLAEMPSVKNNGITLNRLHEIEQMKAEARPMEFDEIADALNVDPDWFRAENLLPELSELDVDEAATLGLWRRRNDSRSEETEPGSQSGPAT